MTQATQHTLFVVRFAGEVATKSDRTRSHFARTLRRNVKAAMAAASLRARLFQRHGRIFVLAEDADRARAQLGRVFGIGTFSAVEARAPARLDAMAETARRHFAERVAGRRFAVRARRRGQHDFSSVDVERRVGAALDGPGRVDLDNPEVTVFVEVLERRAFFFTERIRGAGGLPLGTGGRALVLLSGGFDSAVAAWRVMRRGVAVDFLFCNLAGAAYERQIVQVAAILDQLWAFGARPWLVSLDFAELSMRIKAEVTPRYWQVVLKRLMYRAASRVAAEFGAAALVTGEAMAQVSSQTLANLGTIEGAADRIVLRPLIAHDKQEIMDEAKRIGTGVLSERIPEFCALTDEAPAVKSRPATIEAEETRLGDDPLKGILERRRLVDLADIDARSLRSDYLFTEEVPEDATVIDCQPPRMFEHWHLPGAINLPPEAVVRELRRFDKRQTYILYCTFGTQSAHLAEIMQQLGYQAYALPGGSSRLRRRFAEADSPTETEAAD